MNRSEVVERLVLKGYERKAAGQAVDEVIEAIKMGLRTGEAVSIRNFGKFEPRLKSAVVRRNPKTGQEIHVPAKFSVGFIPAPALKDQLNVNGNGNGKH